MNETIDGRQNFRRILDLLRFADDAARREARRRNPAASEAEIEAFVRAWWEKLDTNEHPPGFVVRKEWKR